MSDAISLHSDLRSLLHFARRVESQDSDSSSSSDFSDQDSWNETIASKLDLLPEDLQLAGRDLCLRSDVHMRVNADLEEPVPEYLYDNPETVENIQYLPEGEIEGIGFYKFIEMMTGEASDLIRVFLCTYPLFATTQEVLSAFIERVRIPVPKFASSQERKAFSQSVLTTMETKLASVFKTWAKLWPELFQQDTEFLGQLKAALPKKENKLSLSMSSTTLANSMQRSRTRDKIVFSEFRSPMSPILPVELDFKGVMLLAWDTTEIARQCTLIEWNYLSRISISECLGRKWEKEGKEQYAGNIVALSKRFASARALFIHSIVNADRDSRPKVIKKLLEVAITCMSTYFNYETPFIIASVMKSDPVMALKKTMLQIKSQAHKDMLKRLATVYTGDFSVVRQEMQRLCNVPCWLALRQELAKIDILHPDFTAAGLINLQKHKLTADVIIRLKQYQSSPVQVYRVGMLYDYLEARNFAIDEVQATHQAEEAENTLKL